MRISVVIATYNRCALLRDCLERLGMQQYERGDEVIVVDNGSSDQTPALLARMASTFPVPLRMLREPEPGKTPALITGINAAQGDILALTDDDVVVAPDWIACARKLFADPELALVGGRVDPRWEDRPSPWLRLDVGQRYGRMASPLALQHYGDRQPLGDRTAVGANLIVRRDVLHAVGGFASHLGRIRGTLMCGEDHEFCQRVIAAGYRAEYVPTLSVEHWVPAARVRLPYFLRWFFWSGVTNAILDVKPFTGPKFLEIPRYIWGRLLRAPIRVAAAVLRGQPADAAAAAMDGAFAAGYVRRRALRGLGGQEIATRHQQAPQLPAPSQSPAIPIPGPETGSFELRGASSTATPGPKAAGVDAEGSQAISTVSGARPPRGAETPM